MAFLVFLHKHSWYVEHLDRIDTDIYNTNKHEPCVQLYINFKNAKVHIKLN